MLISAEKKKESLTGQNKEKEQKIDRYIKEIEELDAENQKYGKCSKISNTLKLRTPKIIVENNI